MRSIKLPPHIRQPQRPDSYIAALPVRTRLDNPVQLLKVLLLHGLDLGAVAARSHTLDDKESWKYDLVVFDDFLGERVETDPARNYSQQPSYVIGGPSLVY